MAEVKERDVFADVPIDNQDAGSAPSSSTFTITSADGAVTDTPHTSANIPAGTAGLNSPSEPTATQSGASATQGATAEAEMWLAEVGFADSRRYSSPQIAELLTGYAASLRSQVDTLKAERDFALDALREIHVAIKGARDDGRGWKEIEAAKRAMDIAERTVTKLEKQVCGD